MRLPDDVERRRGHRNSGDAARNDFNDITLRRMSALGVLSVAFRTSALTSGTFTGSLPQ
jgi:hypothetical protein